jgi:hypothetical protein
MIARDAHGPMTLDEFRATLADVDPPAGLGAPLRALWLEAKGDWKGAHALVDDPRNSAEARVHAYLHRKEGDLSNARYWYRHAGMEPASGSLEAEWESVVTDLLRRAQR